MVLIIECNLNYLYDLACLVVFAYRLFIYIVSSGLVIIHREYVWHSGSIFYSTNTCHIHDQCVDLLNRSRRLFGVE